MNEIRINNLLIDKIQQLNGIKCESTKEELEDPSNFVCTLLDTQSLEETLDLIARHLRCINCAFDEGVYCYKLQTCFEQNSSFVLYKACKYYRTFEGRKDFEEMFEQIKKKEKITVKNITTTNTKTGRIIQQNNEPDEVTNLLDSENKDWDIIHYFFPELHLLLDSPLEKSVETINSKTPASKGYKILVTDVFEEVKEVGGKYYEVNKAIDDFKNFQKRCEGLTQSTAKPKPSFTLNDSFSKIDYIRIINSLSELRCFKNEDGTIPNKKDVMQAYGNLVGIDLSNYNNSINKAFNSNVGLEQNVEIFKKMGDKTQELYLNNQNKMRK